MHRFTGCVSERREGGGSIFRCLGFPAMRHPGVARASRACKVPHALVADSSCLKASSVGDDWRCCAYRSDSKFVLTIACSARDPGGGALALSVHTVLGEPASIDKGA